MDLNLFKLCSGLKFLGYFMILLVAAIIAVSYYAVVILTWGPKLLQGGFNSFLSFTIIAVFHFLVIHRFTRPLLPYFILLFVSICVLYLSPHLICFCPLADYQLVMLLWCYFMVVFCDPGSVPENWKMVVEEGNLEEGNSMPLTDSAAPEILASALSSSDGMERRHVRYCRQCGNGKPPRCHHCSVCQRCVLKMDHHCIWVVNCVGARNYKFFLLFLLYTFLETTMNTLVLLPNFVRFFQEAKNHAASAGHLAIIFLAFVLNLAFALSLLCFVVMHASLLSSNTTSIEVYEKKKAVRWKYDFGRRKNFEQVFGTRKVLWFFPLFSKDDLENIPALQGLDFPTHPDVEV
ncbi:hypothetical protein Vadar_013247 [Vaccinium darrowii]|uniref:Uncharacterized protein n=1 Tax=Vaccinium darrowii TaxID=229202 RepID=A0ACB7ZBH1_9ERIC|nr:hypothetical protein Vadar_013247 [Vaccinium darrowii]